MDLSSVVLCSIVSQQITKSVKAPKWFNHKIWTIAVDKTQKERQSVWCVCFCLIPTPRTHAVRARYAGIWIINFIFVCTSLRWYIFIFMLFRNDITRRQWVRQCIHRKWIHIYRIVKINTLQFQWTLLKHCERIRFMDFDRTCFRWNE